MKFQVRESLAAVPVRWERVRVVLVKFQVRESLAAVPVRWERVRVVSWRMQLKDRILAVVARQEKVRAILSVVKVLVQLMPSSLGMIYIRY